MFVKTDCPAALQAVAPPAQAMSCCVAAVAAYSSAVKACAELAGNPPGLMATDTPNV